MKIQSVLGALRSISFFEGVSDAELQAMAVGFELRSVRKGQRILRLDESGQFMMFLVAGRLNVVHSNDEGREVIIDVITPGEFFGELALLTGRPRSANVDAAEDGSVLVLSQHQFEALILKNERLVKMLLKELAERLYDTSTKAAKLVLLDVYRRLAHVLTSLGKIERRENGVVYVIAQRPTHKELAAMVGTGREMVTRALKELEAAGHIVVEGKQVTVVNLPV